MYTISCIDCNATYVGQTKRQLRIRILEQKDIKKKTDTYSVIFNDRIENNHSFNWKDITIFDNEQNYNKRLISEMIHIIKQKNDLNKQSDTEFLSEAYFPLLNLLTLN